MEVIWEHIRLFEWLTLAAIFLGPIVAVFVTRWVDCLRERGQRRMDVFRTLMRTRRAPISGDHVGALNLIEIEFQNDVEVMAEWRKLFSHFGTEHTKRPGEIVQFDGDTDSRKLRDEQFFLRKWET